MLLLQVLVVALVVTVVLALTVHHMAHHHLMVHHPQHMAGMHHHMVPHMEPHMQPLHTLAILQQRQLMVQVAMVLQRDMVVHMVVHQDMQQHSQQLVVMLSRQAPMEPAHHQLQLEAMDSSSMELRLQQLLVHTDSRLQRLQVQVLRQVCGRLCLMTRAAPTTTTHRQVSVSGRSQLRWREVVADDPLHYTAEAGLIPLGSGYQGVVGKCDAGLVYVPVLRWRCLKMPCAWQTVNA